MISNNLFSVVCSLLCLGSLAPCLIYSEESENCYNNLKQVERHADQTKDANDDDDFYYIAENQKTSKRLRLSRTDQIPKERLKEETASYLEGYIQALIDANYYELNVLVYVNKDGKVFLYNLPNDERIKRSIIAFVKDLPDVEEVEEGAIDPEIEERIAQRQPIRQVKGVWFPESTVLFPPLIANPRDPIYSVAYRWSDEVLANNQIAVSLGDVFPIFRWFDVLPPRGDLQIDIGACMWANFNMNPSNTPNGEWAELVTTDYLLSIPLSYAFDKWAFRLRIYHISSHLGDELMFNQPQIMRLNPSFEAIDFFASFQANDGLRLYAGPGFILNSDQSYPLKVFYAEYGLEYRMNGWRHHFHRIYGCPFFAVDIQQWQANHFTPSVTAQLGYEWSKLQGAGRKVRLFGEYHNGYSEGQFFKERTDYFAIRATWGF